MLMVARTWWTHFVHASVRTNLGPLGWLFVTPQSHRIHHSTDPRHHDRNFGVLFSVWDRLFGLHYARGDEYPATGIVDAPFPCERSAHGRAVLGTLVRQHLYPFQAIAGSLRPGRALSPASSSPAWSDRSWRASLD